MSYTSAYERINWQNTPSVATPINASNLNKMDAAIKALDEAMGDVSKSNRLFSMSVQSVASNKITAYMGDTSIGEAGDLIMLNTLDKSGTTSSSWSLYLTEPTPGGISKTFALKDVDGSAAYTEAVDAGAIMFVMITGTNTANVVGVINAANIDFPLSVDRGGTGNSVGFIQTGKRAGTTVGNNATIEGSDNAVTGNYGHADGYMNTVSGSCATASGRYNNAGHNYQAVVGQFNDNKADTLFEVGNGTATNARSNALEVKSSGDVIAGNDVINADGYSLRAAENAISNPKTATGNPVIVEDALESNAEGLVAQIVPIQSGSGDPSPTNVRPISGRTAVNVGRTGKNLWDGTYSSQSNYIDESGNLTSNNSFNVTDYVSVIGGDYVLTTPTISISPSICWYDASKNFIGGQKYNGASPVLVTLPNNAAYVRFSVVKVTPNYQLEQGTTATAYEEYKGQTIAIALGTTVYGGTLDVKRGVLTITHVIKDLGTLDYTAQTSISSFYTQLSDAVTGATGVTMDGICSQYKVVPTRGSVAETMGQGDSIFAMQSGSKLLFIKDTSKAELTAAEFKTAMSGVQLCYELATPTTVQLTGAELALLMGYNMVTSDSGDITLTYKANAVQNLQDEKADNADMVDFIENGNKASRAYSANQFMLWKGDLYKVTTSIASGATITAGTNVSKTTIGAVLTALLNA